MQNPKQSPFRDAAWLREVRNMPCEITGRQPPSDPAHIRRGSNGGTGLKPDDYVLPLSHELHAEQHRIGEVSFYLAYMTKYSDFMMRCVRARAKEIYLENNK